MSDDKKDVGDRIRRAVGRGAVEALAKQLIAIPSHSGEPTREKEAAEFLHEYLSDNGVSAKLRKVEKDRPNVIATVKGTTGGGKSLMLNGHLDTVPAYEMDISPFTPKVKAGRLYGRGALDMKGGSLPWHVPSSASRDLELTSSPIWCSPQSWARRSAARGPRIS